MLTRNKALVKAIKEKRLFDYIANNGYEYSKNELIDIIKELAFTIEEHMEDDAQEEKFASDLLENIFSYTYVFDRNDDDCTQDEIAYSRYELGIDTYEDYLAVCEVEECNPLLPIREE